MYNVHGRLDEVIFKLDYSCTGMYIYSSKNLRTSTYVFPLFNTESLIFKIENIS